MANSATTKRFAGKVFLVTGASSGIGAVTAEHRRPKRPRLGHRLPQGPPRGAGAAILWAQAAKLFDKAVTVTLQNLLQLTAHLVVDNSIDDLDRTLA
eukprot:jgi/Chlat1/6152/Chrsp41S05723